MHGESGSFQYEETPENRKERRPVPKKRQRTQKKRMKKALVWVLAFLVALSAGLGLISCQAPGPSTRPDGSKDPIRILYSKDYTSSYTRYTEKSVASGDVGATIESLSGGRVRADGNWVIPEDGKEYSIYLEKSDEPKRAASREADAYLETLTDMQPLMEDAPVRYRSSETDNRDVVLVAEGDEENGTPVVKIYVFVFAYGSARAIAEAAASHGDPGHQSDPGGHTGDPGTDPGQETGEEPGTTTVTVWNLDASGKKEAVLTYDVRNGETIDLWSLGEGWILYTDANGTQTADYTKDMVAGGGTLELYRKDKDNKDFIGVEFVRYYTDRFGKDGYYDTYSAVYRKGEMVSLFSDVFTLYGGEDLALYYDLNKTKPLDPQKTYGFTESVKIYAFCKNNSYTSYDVIGADGSAILTQALNYVSLGTEGNEFHSETVNIRATVTDTSLSDDARSFRVKDVRHSKTYTVAYCYNGHVVKTERWFFEDNFAWAVAQNSMTFTDATLTTNTSYEGDASGIHYFTSNVTVYLPLEASGFVTGD